MITNWRIGIPTVVYPYKRILVYMKMWMNLTHYAKLKKPDTNEYIIRDFIHMWFKNRLTQLNVMESKIVVISRV